MDASVWPLAWANYLSMGGFALLGVLVWLVPRRLIFSEAPDAARWRDFRLWATALIALQIGIYALFT